MYIFSPLRIELRLRQSNLINAYNLKMLKYVHVFTVMQLQTCFSWSYTL